MRLETGYEIQKGKYLYSQEQMTKTLDKRKVIKSLEGFHKLYEVLSGQEKEYGIRKRNMSLKIGKDGKNTSQIKSH